MRARTGKIARLPSHIRHELNRRLDNGALGTNLISWLNSLPEVQQVLAQRFAGKPISDDNLSQWRHGGFQDWLLQEERRIRLGELESEFHQIDPALHSTHLAAATEQRLALELTEQLELLSTIKNRAERSKQLRRLCQEHCRLQNTHTNERHVRLLEAKASSHRPIAPHARPNRADSDLPEPFRTKNHRGGSGTGVSPVRIKKQFAVIPPPDNCRHDLPTRVQFSTPDPQPLIARHAAPGGLTIPPKAP